MSRKWARQVERNSKRINAQRKRLGQSSIGQTGKDNDMMKGRSLMLPAFLLFVGISYMISFWQVDRGGLFWVTVVSYFLLAVIVFAWRRPFLKIGKQSLSTRKFAGMRTVYADDIEQIEAQNGYVVIMFKNKKARWVFSRTFHRYDTKLMAEKLRNFASANQVTFQQV